MIMTTLTTIIYLQKKDFPKATPMRNASYFFKFWKYEYQRTNNKGNTVLYSTVVEGGTVPSFSICFQIDPENFSTQFDGSPGRDRRIYEWDWDTPEPWLSLKQG